MTVNRDNIALLVLAIGFLFSAITALGLTVSICTTGGCELYRDVSIFGVNVYWFAAVYFIIAAVLIKQQLSMPLHFWMLAGVLISAVLLLVQAATSPCTSCMIVAGLIVCSYALIVKSAVKGRFLALWGFAFIMVMGVFFNQSFKPVPIFGSERSTVKFFFSPSCPSCVEELSRMSVNTDILQHLAIFPVIIGEGDAAAIARMQEELKRSRVLSYAVKDMLNAEKDRMSMKSLLNARIISFFNKAFLAKNNVSSVPYLLTSSPSILTAPRVPTVGVDNSLVFPYIDGGGVCPFGSPQAYKCEMPVIIERR